MHVVGNQETQFRGILKNGWHFGRSAPVEVQMRMLVCPYLEFFR